MDDAESHLPRLSPIQIERLALLSEELGEAQQAVGKILRHGLYSINPDGDPSWQNYQDLERELGHVVAAIMLLSRVIPCSWEIINRHRDEKLKTVSKYLHHGKASEKETKP